MTTPAERHKARHYAMQALYQWQMNEDKPHEILAQFRADYDMKHVDYQYLQELVKGVIASASTLDESFEPYLVDRALGELDPITISLLRMATFELQNRIDVPFKVVINEAVALAKKFGATDSHKFINGVLDRAAEQWRALEKAVK